MPPPLILPAAPNSGNGRELPPTATAARWLPALLPAALILGLAGCQAPARPAGPTDVVLQIPDREAFLDASLSVLRHYDLPPDRVDRESGLIVTHRTTSAQWFEFWRVDSPGPYQSLESSLHTIGRVVTVAVESAGGPPMPEPAVAETGAAASAPTEPYRVTVRVDKWRYSAPERQITTASGALAIFNEKVPTTEGLRGAAAPRAHWVALGRDGLLESFLLAKLIHANPAAQLVE